MKIFQYLLLLTFGSLLVPAFCLGQDSGLDDLDTDSDGKVTKKEFQEYAKGKLQGFDQIEKFADRVDADKDGAISEDEFEDRMEALQALNQEMLNGGDKKKEMSKEELKMVDEATKAYGEMAKLISKGDWEKTAAKMTKQANDDYVIGMIVQSIAITEMQLPPQMDVPAVNKAKDATVDVIEKFKLDDIDISSMMRDQGGIGGPNVEEDDDDDEDEDSDKTPEQKAKAKQDKAQAKLDKIKAEIKTTIDKNDQRWKVVAALREAQKGSPFERDVFAGKISESDVDDDAVFLTVTRKIPGRRVAIPTVLKMTTAKGDWKYAGIDRARTQVAMQQMVQRMRGRRAPAKPDTDF